MGAASLSADALSGGATTFNADAAGRHASLGAASLGRDAATLNGDFPGSGHERKSSIGDTAFRRCSAFSD